MGKGKVTLEMLLLAAAAIASQLVGPAVETAQVKHVKELSVEEVNTLERVLDYCVCDSEGEESNT